ncbi:MAG: DUF167 domain-containing protein [Gammaproteobacteria bacterium]
MQAWFGWHGDQLLDVHVTVQTRASQPGVQGLHAGRLKLRVRAAPSDGQANREASSLLAGLFGVPPSRVLLHRGTTSRQKVFRIKMPAVRPETIVF